MWAPLTARQEKVEGSGRWGLRENWNVDVRFPLPRGLLFAPSCRVSAHNSLLSDFPSFFVPLSSWKRRRRVNPRSSTAKKLLCPEKGKNTSALKHLSAINISFDFYGG